MVKELDTKESSRQTFSISYNGDTREDDHTIDVENLAPALLAFGKLLNEANIQTNKKQVSSRTLVISRFEDKCFQIDFDFIVSVFPHVKTLLGSVPVQTAKDILELVGLVKSAKGEMSLLEFLKLKNGKQITEVTKSIDQEGSGNVAVQIEGKDHKTIINNNVYNLSNNHKTLRAIKDTLNPIGQDGFDKLELKKSDKVIDTYDQSESEAIIASCVSGIEEAIDTEPMVEERELWLSVYSPVYDANIENWRFNLGQEHVYVDVSATSIASNALKRGGAMVNDSYLVNLEITTPHNKDGKELKQKFKILKVLKFIPATPQPQQADIFDESNDSKKDK